MEEKSKESWWEEPLVSVILLSILGLFEPARKIYAQVWNLLKEFIIFPIVNCFLFISIFLWEVRWILLVIWVLLFIRYIVNKDRRKAEGYTEIELEDEEE